MLKVEDFLKEKGVSYRLLPHEKPAYSCEDAAIERKVPLNEMVKSILLVDKAGKYCLACLLADSTLDPQSIRRLLPFKRLSFAPESKISDVTGFELGSVPPVSFDNGVPVVFDEAILLKKKVNISAGVPTLGLELASRSLIRAVDPIVFRIVK